MRRVVGAALNLGLILGCSSGDGGDGSGGAGLGGDSGGSGLTGGAVGGDGGAGAGGGIGGGGGVGGMPTGGSGGPVGGAGGMPTGGSGGTVGGAGGMPTGGSGGSVGGAGGVPTGGSGGSVGGAGGAAGAGGGGGAPLAPLGAACGDASECDSGYCADDVCCDAACDATCVACVDTKTGETTGACAPVTVDTDPDVECADAGPQSCGAIGHCNGSTAEPGCVLYDLGTPCADASCTGGVDYGPAECDGAGSCVPGGAMACATGQCHPSGVGCYTGQCAGPEDCFAQDYCDVTTCTPMLGDGDPCDSAQSCQSGFCDDYCCAVECGTCGTCTTDGQSCQLYAAGTDPDGDCSVTQPCNGEGACSGTALFQVLYSENNYTDMPNGGAWTPTGEAAVAANNSGDAAAWMRMSLDCEVSFYYCPPYANTYVHRFGTTSWSKQLDDWEWQDIALDEAGNMLLAVRTNQPTLALDGTLLPASAGGNAWAMVLIKLDPNGSLIWSKSFSNTFSGSPILNPRLAVDAMGSVFIAGVLRQSLDFGGGTLVKSGTDHDIFAVKLDGNGNHLWSKHFGDAEAQSPDAVTVDGSGNVILSGAFRGVIDFGGGELSSVGSTDNGFLAKLDGATGAEIWSASYGTGRVGSASADASDAIVLKAWGTGCSTAGCLRKLDASGILVWEKGYPTSDFTVSTEASGHIAVLFRTGDPAFDYGAGPVPFASSSGMVVLSLAADGSHIFSRSSMGSGYPLARRDIAAWNGGAIYGGGSFTLDWIGLVTTAYVQVIGLVK